MALLATALLVAAPAVAQVPELTPLNYALRYDVAWSNIPIGRIRMTIKEDTFRYEISLDIKTRGIVRMFDSTVSTITATGHFKPEGMARANRYQSVSTDDDSSKVTTVTYAEDGTIEHRERKPADDPNNRPPVPLHQANEAQDPLTAMYALRHTMRKHMVRNERTTTARTYDGARLADFTFKVISPATMEIMGEHIRAINTVLKREPIAGYKQKELKKFKEGDPTIHVYFSADSKLLPVKADIKLRFGTISATLTDLQPIQ